MVLSAYTPGEAAEQDPEHLPQWFTAVLHGIVATLWAYCISSFVPSPLASFAVAAGYQVIMFLVCVPSDGSQSTLTWAEQIYSIGYLVTFAYARPPKLMEPSTKFVRRSHRRIFPTLIILFSIRLDWTVPIMIGSFYRPTFMRSV